MLSKYIEWFSLGIIGTLREYKEWFQKGEEMDAEHMIKCLDAYCHVSENYTGQSSID